MNKNLQNQVAVHKQRAVKLMTQGKLQAAREIASKLCRKNKNDAESQYILGSIYGEMKRYDDAIRHFEACLKLQPDAFVTHFSLGRAYAALKNYTASEAAYRHALKLQPGDIQTQIWLAIVLAEQGNLTDAEKILLTVLQTHPTEAEALDVLGDIHYQKQQFRDAINYYEKALDIAPDRIDSSYYYGNSLLRLGLTDKAVSLFQHVAKLDPDNVSAYVHIGHCLKQNGEPDQARNAYEQALQIEPDNLTATVGIIDLCEREAEFEAAYELLTHQIQRGEDEVDLATAFVRLCHRFNSCDEAIEYALKVLKNSNIPELDLSRLEYALGKKFDKMGEFDTAFSHYQRANILSQQSFDPDAHRVFIDSLINTYSWQFFTQVPRASVHSSRPVFIVGMPRSGTSLTEQILASHPDVFGAGELTGIGDAIQAIGKNGQQLQYPLNMKDINSESLDEIAEQYLKHINSLSSTALRVTDKNPTNFLHLGLIALAFPEARIIHCTREPLDNCLSIYFQGFSVANPYATNLEHIGLYYRQYDKFMRHIKGVLEIPVLDVAYEDLVSNQEGMTRKLLEFIDLDWDEKCMDFYKNKRFVATPSYEQVRESIYTHAVGRWNNYEKHLKPLLNVLK